jgi:hypothetical protein
MIKISSFLNGKNLCNIFASTIVEKINELSPDAKTQISVINVGSFFIVKGQTSSEVLVNPSKILSEIYNKYDSNLSKTVRVIDTILYNNSFELDYLHIEFNESLKERKLTSLLTERCNQLQKKGLYLNLEVDPINNILYYDLDFNKDYNSTMIESLFSDFNCIKDDFSQKIFISDEFYGLSNDGIKNYHYLIRKISYNLLERGFANNLIIQISSDKKLLDIDVENINLNINGKLTVFKDSLESLVLDTFKFGLNDLSNSFKSVNYDVIDSFINQIVPKIWENTLGTGDLMFL